ncbi:hypothetical protein RN001_010561 [Aquatica leii]|uniref:Myrosinase 1-like n=1 Tax=Aquatica leii TaxID=1421715 RepID=A0AAN7SQD6_9COLE|nr:hypothetical protein RN001_010561 [Aquatica leii]
MLFVLVTLLFISKSNVFGRSLPDDLLVGTATSAYQVEGAWNLDGKGENIWDRFVHTRPDKIVDRSTGDVACDSYNKYKSDVELMKNAGFQFYRFSISWSRILPHGYSNVINPNGIYYYNNLINVLLENGIVPVVTLYHFDLPQVLQDLGGWTNAKVVKWFEDFAGVVFDHFADRVKVWITINEPKQVCSYGYGVGMLAPGIESSGLGEYMCARNLLLAHASAYHLYKKRYGVWYEPSSEADVEATERQRQFDFGIYTHPIYSGDFPDVVKSAVANRSKYEGFSESRLPVLTGEEVNFIKSTSDFFGLNYYTSFYVRDKVPDPIGAPSSTKDANVDLYQDPSWPSSSVASFKSVPWGLRKLLGYIKQHYGDPEIVIGENGFPDLGEFNDCTKIQFFLDHLSAVLDAIDTYGARVKLYTAWSLIDNFEWSQGYRARFGFYAVNFTSPDLARSPKLSAKFFQDLLNSRVLPIQLKLLQFINNQRQCLRHINLEYDNDSNESVNDNEMMKTLSVIVFLFVGFAVTATLAEKCTCKCVSDCKSGQIHPAADCVRGFTPCCRGDPGDWSNCKFV